MTDQDLQRVSTAQVKGGENSQEELGEKQEGYQKEEIWPKVIINYNKVASHHQTTSRSYEGQDKPSTEESIHRTSRSYRSGHSILQTLGKTQAGGDKGEDEGQEENIEVALIPKVEISIDYDAE